MAGPQGDLPRMTCRSRIQVIVLFVVSFGGLAAQTTGPRLPPILGTGSGPGPSYDCGGIDAAVLTQSVAVQTQCPLALLGGAAFYTDQIRGDNLLVAFNKEGAMVVIHNQPAEATSIFTGTVDHIGQQDDVIHWGLWRSGAVESLPSKQRHTVDESIAIPYIVGVSSSTVASSDRFSRHLRRLTALPAEGIAKYTLLGDVGVISRKDMRGNVVPIGKVQAAHATVDFKNSTGQVDLSIEVRGTIENIQLSLEPQDRTFGFGPGATGNGRPCRKPAMDGFCPTAAAQFYGRDGQFLGVTFAYGHNAVLSEAASVAAYLNNVPAQGAVVLRRD